MGTARSLHRRIDPQILGQTLKAMAERNAPIHKQPRPIRTYPPLVPPPRRHVPPAYQARRAQKERRRLAREQSFAPVALHGPQPFQFPKVIRKLLGKA